MIEYSFKCESCGKYSLRQAGKIEDVTDICTHCNLSVGKLEELKAGLALYSDILGAGNES